MKNFTLISILIIGFIIMILVSLSAGISFIIGAVLVDAYYNRSVKNEPYR